jgi:hypothetical protein
MNSASNSTCTLDAPFDAANTLQLGGYLITSIALQSRLAEKHSLEMPAALQSRQEASPTVKASQGETNCGPDGPYLTFNEKEQFVSTTGQYPIPAQRQTRFEGLALVLMLPPTTDTCHATELPPLPSVSFHLLKTLLVIVSLTDNSW